jgi:hypothetical protein
VPELRRDGVGNVLPELRPGDELALPTVRALLSEATGRYVALDGRLWRTLFGLLFRPGFLTREYFAGRRRRYIRPARLFLVLSIALLRFTGEPPKLIDQDLTQAERDEITSDNAIAAERLGLNIDADLKLRVNVAGGGWFDPLRRRAEVFNRLPPQEKADQIFAGMLRYGPYAMFVLLPLFALLAKLVYLGRARRYPARPRRYAAHLVFGAHNDAFLFLVVALIALLPVALLRGALVVWAMVYLLWSMKTVYGGRWSGVLARARHSFRVFGSLRLRGRRARGRRGYPSLIAWPAPRRGSAARPAAVETIAIRVQIVE